jgi:cyclopropane-fatty-acyl-phospholipid synthase
MISLVTPRPSPARAARILREVFGHLPGAYAFRLWDGTEVRLGAGDPVGTAVIRSPEIFVSLLADPSPGNFAEAYVAGAIDLEGDLFATMDVANAAEEIRLSRGRKLRLYLSMWRR